MGFLSIFGKRKGPVTIGRVGRQRKWTDIVSAVLKGKSVLFVDGSPEARVMGTEGWPQRAIEDPQLEASRLRRADAFNVPGLDR